MPQEVIEQAEAKEEAKTEQAETKQDKQATEVKGEVKGDLKYSDDDLDRLINRAIAKERKRSEDKIAEEKKKLSEAQKLEKMNDDEKTKYELENLRKEKAELQAKIDFDEQKKIARATLSDANILISDDLLDMIVSGDADKTKASVDAFKKCYLDAVNDGVANALKRNAPFAEKSKKAGESAGAKAAKRHNAQYEIKPKEE